MFDPLPECTSETSYYDSPLIKSECGDLSYSLEYDCSSPSGVSNCSSTLPPYSQVQPMNAGGYTDQQTGNSRFEGFKSDCPSSVSSYYLPNNHQQQQQQVGPAYCASSSSSTGCYSPIHSPVSSTGYGSCPDAANMNAAMFPSYTGAQSNDGCPKQMAAGGGGYAVPMTTTTVTSDYGSEGIISDGKQPDTVVDTQCSATMIGGYSITRVALDHMHAAS